MDNTGWFYDEKYRQWAFMNHGGTTIPVYVGSLLLWRVVSSVICELKVFVVWHSNHQGLL